MPGGCLLTRHGLHMATNKNQGSADPRFSLPEAVRRFDVPIDTLQCRA